MMIELFFEKLKPDFPLKRKERLTKAVEKINEIFGKEDFQAMEACKYFKTLKENFSDEEIGDLHAFFQSMMDFANENPGIILAEILTPVVDVDDSVDAS